MENRENQMSFISIPERSYLGRVERGSSLPGLIRAKTFAELREDLADIQRAVVVNGDRLRRIEERRRARAEIPLEEAVQAKEEYIRLQEEEDKQFCKDMAALAGNDYEAKKKVYARAHEKDLSPLETKRKYKSDQ